MLVTSQLLIQATILQFFRRALVPHFEKDPSTSVCMA